METIKFTTRVLGPAAAYRLDLRQVTQTLRSESYSLTADILNGRVSAGEILEVTLDGIIVGHVELLSMDAVTWVMLDIDDARRGGFDSLAELANALRRGGFRFLPVSDYHFYRIQFRWLENEKPKVAESRGRAEVSSPAP